MNKFIIKLILVFGWLNYSQAQNLPTYVPTNGLVGWWPFNGNANDESGNGNNGTVIGATLTGDRFDNSATAYSFNGTNNFIYINNTVGNFQNSNFTISCWVKDVDSINGGTLISKRKDIGYGNFFSMSWGNAPSLELNQNLMSDYYSYRSSSNLLNNWKSYVLSRTGNIIKIYINGNLHFTDTTSVIHNINNTANLTFGARYAGTNMFDHINSKLDDIGIWNRALTESEIKRLYNASLCFQSIAVTDTLIINVNRTGYNPITFENTLKVYPNPTKDKITIDNGNLSKMTGYSIKIMNSLGQQVFQGNINQQQFDIDITAWGGNGIYYLHLMDKTGNTVEFRKILLQ